MDVISLLNLYEDDSSKTIANRERQTGNDIESFLSAGLIKVNNETHALENCSLDIGRYKDLISEIDEGSIYLSKDYYYVKIFSPRIFKENIFKDIYILTYQFEWQLQAAYFKAFDIDYKMGYATKNDKGNYILKEGLNTKDDEQWRLHARKLIHIHSDVGKNTTYNAIGAYYKDSRGVEHQSALSKSWYKKHAPFRKNADTKDIAPKNEFVTLAKNVNGYVRGFNKPSTQTMWGTFKDWNRKNNSKFKKVIGSSSNCKLGRDNKNFVPINCRATNNYSHKTVLAYTVNYYIHPGIKGFFEFKGIDFNEDKFALSVLVQWIWRSAIRKNKPIDIYIPSQRMRELLIDWLNPKIAD